MTGRGLLALLLMFCCAGAAQPYVAGGGFDRPALMGSSPVLTRFALASGEGGAIVYWNDQQGVLARNLTVDQEPLRVAEGRGIRGLAAAEVGGDVALAWVDRDLASGTSRHWLRWREQDRLILEALQPYHLDIVEFRDMPAVLISRRSADEAVLRLIGWEGEEVEVTTSPRTLERYEAAPLPDGGAAIAWLEGFTDRNALGGTVSQWVARLTTVSAAGEAAPPVTLGPARNLGNESRLAVGVHEGRPAVLWPGAGSDLKLSIAGGETITVASGPSSSAGHPSAVGLADGRAYWTEGTSLRAVELVDVDESFNAAWSPVTISGGELVEHGGSTFLAWYGPTTGGRFEIYAADDQIPLDPSWQDHLAAAMGWSPWGFWEALVGQVLGALFAALVVCMVLSPLLWVAAMVAVRMGWTRRSTLVGIGAGLLLVFSTVSVMAVRSRLTASQQEALFGTPLQLAACLAIAALLTWLLRRRSDSEPMIGIMGSGGLFLFLALSGLAFLTFQSWVEHWSQLV